MRISSGRFFAVLTLILVVLFFVISRQANINSFDQDKKPTVVASFYPLYFFVSRIGGDVISPYNVTPAGAEPHDYEPTTGDLSTMERSVVVIANGAGLESWGSHVATTLAEKHIPFVQTSQSLATLTATEAEKETVKDPHTWLDPVLMQEQVKMITRALVEALPSHAEQFRFHEEQELIRLQELDHEFSTALAQCHSKNIVTSHQAFGYLAKRYGLKQLAVSGISPDAEPSPREISNLVDFVRRNKVKYIFFETLISPKIAQTIANETGVSTLVFNPLEGLTDKEIESGADYYSIMRQNLVNLKKALECK
jgi:zinc transport system substrate-binding protein